MTTAGGGRLDEKTAAGLLPRRDARGHKGTFGRVVAVAGSLDYAGAALMTGAAALRAGSGLVTLCLPASLQPHLVGRVPELITRGLPEAAPYAVEPDEAAAMVAGLPCDGLLIGPGLVPEAATTRLVVTLLAGGGVPAVVDAGALAVLADREHWWSDVGRPLIVTPHPGEFARLGRDGGAGTDEDRRVAALEAAREWGAVVVLKGACTVVAEPDGRALTAPFEVPALGSGGTGDVLAGIIASLVGQGLAPFDAAALGVYLHARAGEDVSARLGDAGLMATDLLPVIPRVRRHLGLVGVRQSGGRLGFEAPADEGA